jgi:hypothetical protein
VPQTLLVTAVTLDPSGGGLAIVSWLSWWPALASVLGAVPLLLVTSGEAGAALLAGVAVWTVVATAALVHLLGRDPKGT